MDQNTEYICPICPAINGLENESTWIKQADFFYRDELVAGFISSKFIHGNEGHPLLVPLKHYKNIYELPPKYGHQIIEVSSRVAKAVKAVRKCDGITILQNNEPAGDQHAFHYHMHIVPRFTDDLFHSELMKARKSEPSERITYANQLREYLNKS